MSLTRKYQMILVTHPSKPFQFNAKALPRRGVIIKEYNDEIEALYKEVEQSTQSDVAAPAIWDTEHTHAFVQTAVEKVLQRALADHAFAHRLAKRAGGAIMVGPGPLVVAPDLTVYGVTGLSVADGSVIPLIPATHLCSTVYAIAEKAADMIKHAEHTL